MFSYWKTNKENSNSQSNAMVVSKSSEGLQIDINENKKSVEDKESSIVIEEKEEYLSEELLKKETA